MVMKMLSQNYTAGIDVLKNNVCQVFTTCLTL